MNAYLIEAHRPSATWEKQTRLVSGKSVAEVTATVENLGLVILQVTAVSKDVAYSMNSYNPRLLVPWKVKAEPNPFLGAEIPESSPLYRK